VELKSGKGERSAKKGLGLKDLTRSFFWAKSAETLEKKRVEFLEGARKCKKEQKSVQEYEKKELE